MARFDSTAGQCKRLDHFVAAIITLILGHPDYVFCVVGTYSGTSVFLFLVYGGAHAVYPVYQ